MYPMGIKYDESGSVVEQESSERPFRGFFGHYNHALDVKNRAFIPAKFRGGLAPGFMLTKGIDTCLIGYPFEDWHRIVNNFKKVPFTDAAGREFIRFFNGSVYDCDVDKQMRFCIPLELREYAQLNKDICFVGMIDYFEIWDSARWKEASSKYDGNASLQAEKMQKYLYFDDGVPTG